MNEWNEKGDNEGGEFYVGEILEVFDIFFQIYCFLYLFLFFNLEVNNLTYYYDFIVKDFFKKDVNEKYPPIYLVLGYFLL